MKNLLQSGYKPLHQVVSRDLERNVSVPVILEINVPKVRLSKGQTSQPTEVMHGVHYKRIFIDEVILQTGKKDSCVMFITDEVIIIEDIVYSENVVFLVGKVFQETNDFYTYPLPSFILGILSVSQISENVKILSISEIKAKCWLMPNRDSFLCIPLLHTFSIFQALR